MNESQLTTKIIKALRKRGGFWIKIHGSAYQTTGLPDIIGCYKGRFIALEVKLPEKLNTLSPRQRMILTRVRQQGGYSRVITSKQDALEAILEIDDEHESDYRAI